MVINKVLGNISDVNVECNQLDKVYIEWYELDKKLMRKVSEFGEEIGIKVDVGLKEGDILFQDDSKIIVVETLPTSLTSIHVDTMKEMGRLCFELGNRHLSLSIGENVVKVPYDEPTFLYLDKLGFNPQKEEARFVDYTVCHGHGEHTHQHTHEHIHEHKQIHQHVNTH